MNSNSLLARIINAPFFCWLLLVLPACYWLFAYWRETIFYGEILHFTGDFSVQLLIVTLALTPLRLWLPKARWLFWLSRRRRYLGVASFAYAGLHMLVYLQRKADLKFILDDAKDIGIWTGWLAMLIMLALALTSNNWSVRRLKHAWQSLHRLVYFAAIATFAHWVLTAFDPMLAYIHLSVWVLLLVIRLIHPLIKTKLRITNA